MQVQPAVTQRADRAFELLAPDLPEPGSRLVRVQVRIVDLTLLAAGAGDEVDATALRDGTRDQATGRERLIVRVGVDKEEPIGSVVASPICICAAWPPAQPRLWRLGQLVGAG